MEEEEEVSTEEPPQHQRSVSVQLWIASLVVVALVAGLVGRLSVPLSELSPLSGSSGASGATHLCTQSRWDAQGGACAQDEHEFTPQEAESAKIAIAFSGPGDRHFVGIVLEQLDPSGTEWQRVGGDSMVARLTAGQETWGLKSLLSAPQSSTSGRYRLRTVIDDKALPAYTLDIVLDAQPDAGPGGP